MLSVFAQTFLMSNDHIGCSDVISDIYTQLEAAVGLICSPVCSSVFWDPSLADVLLTGSCSYTNFVFFAYSYFLVLVSVPMIISASGSEKM